MLLRFHVVLLLYIQTTHIHVADGVAKPKNNTGHNNTSLIVRPTILKSSGYHHSSSTRVRTSDSNSVRLFASHTATYLPMSVGLGEITQTTNIALPSSVPVRRSYSPVEILSASKDGNMAQKTEALRTNSFNSALAVGENSVRESRLNSDKVTASEEKSTQSSYVAENNTQSYYDNFSGKTDTSASFVQQRTRTANIVQTASTIQAKPSSPSHTKGNRHLSSSSFNPGKSEIYHTHVPERKSLLSTAQTSNQEITTLTSDAFRRSASSALCSKIGDCSSKTTYMRTITAPHNIATSLTLPQSLISNTYEGKTPAASGHVSYLSKAEHSTLRLTNNFNQSQVHGSLTLTILQNTSQSNLKTLTSSLNIIPRASQTPQLFNSISYSMITTSSQSMSHGLISLKLEHSSQGSEDRKPEEIGSSSHFIVLQHSFEHSQKSTITVSVPLSNDSKEITDIPLYVLAICLPIGFLVGFCLAFVFIKRSKQEQRTRYSVTVEVSSDDPNYTMKRMYSIIDMNAGNINKDFWPSLQSDNSSSSIGFELTSQSSDVALQSSKAPDDDVTDMPL